MALEEIGISVASEIIKEPAQDFLVIVKRHARYFFCFNNIAKDLGTRKEELQAKFQGFWQRAKDDENSNKKISEEVDKWLKGAKKHIEEADDLEEETKQRRKCFLGWCPNCIWQYRLGKKMAKKIEKVGCHQANTQFPYFSRLPTLTGQGPSDFMYFDSRKKTHDALLDALGDSKNHRIGLYGMGGLGKTSLVKEVRKEVMKSESFDKVAFVVVSNPPDVGKIQEEIAESLRLKFEEQSESNKAERLYTRLTNGEKILLILDDVWHQLDFKAIGIPLEDSQPGYCRVLLTTRRADVCRFMGCQSQIELSMLPDEDAWKLFNKHAGIIEETPPTRLQVVAQDIAKQCKGLPVAIAAVASTLKNHNLQGWEEALRTLEDPKPLLANIDDELEEIYKCLKLSYDNLKDERAKKLFLLCSLFPEDYEIPMEDLIRYGIGLGIFGDGDCYGRLRSKVDNVQKKLIDSCMLVNASPERESVKMHDLVRDVARWIANGDIQEVMGPKNFKVLLEEDIGSKDIVKYLWFHIKKVHETPDLLNNTELNVLDPLNWPKLKILVIIVESGLDFIDVSNIFLKGSDSLQVLTLIDGTRWWRDKWARMQIPELINIQTLRLNGWDLGDISVIGNLKGLKTLELEHCSIMELPHGILGLKKLRLLGLLCCLVEKNPFGVFGRLSQLEELYFTKSPSFENYWKVDGEGISEFFDEKCCLRNLERYHIEIGGDSRLYTSFEGTKCDYLKHKSLYIQHLDASTSNATVKNLVQRAEILYLRDIQGPYKSITPDIVQAVGGLRDELIELKLESCSEIQYLLDTTSHLSEIGPTFSNLVELELNAMASLKELCHGPSPSKFLQKLKRLSLRRCEKMGSILCMGNLNLCNLKSVTVRSCPALKSLFTLSMALSLRLLEDLTIAFCNGLKYIIADQREKENEDNIVQENDESDQKVADGSMFPKLNSITIYRCNSLECIFPLSLAGGLEQLEEMIIEEATELKTIFSRYPYEDHPLHENPKEITLPALRRMHFLNVPKFISIFPVFYQLSDQPLQSINLESTALMVKRILFFQEPEKLTHKNPEWVLPPVATAQCHLRHLKEIRLSLIPKMSLFELSTAQEMSLECLSIISCHKLKHIIANEQEDYDDNNYEFVTVFPKLRKLEVGDCSVLEMVLPIALARGLLQLESVHLHNCAQLEYLFGHNDYFSCQFKSDIHIEFPTLKKFELRELPKMISICSRNCNPTWPILKTLWLSKCPLLKTSSIVDCITRKGSRENVIGDNQSRIEVPALENMLNFEMLVIDGDGELEGIFVLEGLLSSRQKTKLSPKLYFLILKNIPKLRHIFRTPVLLSLQNLRSLTVCRCGKLSYVFSACVWTNIPKLYGLEISDCDQLEQITEDHEDHIVCFPNLEEITIRRCNKLKSLFCSSNELPRLKELSIEEASQLEEVFRHKMCNVEDKLMLPSLSKLGLVKLPNLVGICHAFELHSVKNLTVKDCPKLPSKSTATIEALPHEHQNAELEKGNEANDTEDEEIEKKLEVAVKDRDALGLTKGKQPAVAVSTSNEAKDPQTSTNAGMDMTQENDSEVEESKEAKVEDEAKRVLQMAMVQTTTSMTDENAIHHDTTKGDRGEKGEVQIEVAQTTIHQDKVKGSSALTNPNDGGDTAAHMTKNNYSVSLKKLIEDPAESSRSVISSVEEYASFTNIGAILKHSEKEGKEAKIENTEDSAPLMAKKGHSEEEEGKEAKRVMQTAMVKTTTPTIDENTIHRDTMKGPSEIVLTNLINEDDHAEEKEEKGEVHIEVAHTAIHGDKVEGSSALTNPNEGRDNAPQTTIQNYSEEEIGKEAKRVVRMAMVQTTTPTIDEDAIHRGTVKGPSEIVFTNLINEDEHGADGLAILIDHVAGTTNESHLVAKQAEELPKQEEEADQMVLEDKDTEETRPRKRKCTRKSQSIIASKQPADPKPKSLRKKTTMTIRKSGHPVSTTMTQQEGQTSSIGKNTIELSPNSANNLEIQEISSRTSSQQAVNFVENEVPSNEQLDPTFDQENPDLADLNIHLDVLNPDTHLQNAALDLRQPIQTKTQTDLVQEEDLTGFNGDDEDEDPFAILHSLILADESISRSSDERKAQIRQALHALDDILPKDIETLLGNEEDREKLESNLKFLKDATESDAAIIVGLKSFILNLSEQLPHMLESMSKSSAVEDTYQSLVRHKQSVAEFYKFGVQQKMEFADKRRACTEKVEANSKQIWTLEAEISQLQRKLEQLKSARPDLEAALKALNAEEQELKRRAKDAVKDFQSTTSKILGMEVERKVMLEIKTKTVSEWQDFRNTFDSLFKKFVDN